MSTFRLLVLAGAALSAALLLGLYVQVRGTDAAQAGKGLSPSAQVHQVRLADGDQDQDQGDDQDPGDQIQVPEQQEEQQEGDPH
jgi:hypothetical protein